MPGESLSALSMGICALVTFVLKAGDPQHDAAAACSRGRSLPIETHELRRSAPERVGRADKKAHCLLCTCTLMWTLMVQ